MKEEYFKLDEIPAVIYGDKADKVYIFIHGKMGNKEEAADFAKSICGKGYQVLGIDLPGHGERSTEIESFVPWKVIPELQAAMRYAENKWSEVSLRANSIGAYFSMLSFSSSNISKVLFVSPILDMVQLLRNMMMWSDVSEAMLQEKKTIPTNFGETLDWNYYQYAIENQMIEWKHPTFILYAGKDNLTERKTIDDFVLRNGCSLTVMENGEHWFHTPEQLLVLERWTAENS